MAYREWDNDGCVLFVDGDPLFELDITNRISHKLSSSVSTYPVERLQDAAYLARPEAVIVSLDGFVNSVTGTDGDDQNDRDRIAWNMLKTIRDDRLIVELHTYDDVYENMIITHAEKTDSNDTLAVLSVSLEFTQVSVSEIDERNIPAEIIAAASGARSGGRSRSDSGNKQSQQMTDEEVKRRFNETFGANPLLGM